MNDADKKGIRRANFSNEEIGTITEFVKNNKGILLGKLSPTVTKRKKEELWKELAETVSAIGVSPRTVLEIKTKFKNLKMNAKQNFQLLKKSRVLTGGGHEEKLKAGEENLYDVFQDSPAFNGLNGFVSGDNNIINEVNSGTSSENLSSDVAGPSYDIAIG